MGITNKEHREAIWREILKLRLKADIVEIRDLERRHNYFNYDLWQKDSSCDSEGISWKERYPLLKKYCINGYIYNKRSAVAHLYRALLIIIRVGKSINRWFKCCYLRNLYYISRFYWSVAHLNIDDFQKFISKIVINTCYMDTHNEFSGIM